MDRLDESHWNVFYYLGAFFLLMDTNIFMFSMSLFFA